MNDAIRILSSRTFSHPLAIAVAVLGLFTALIGVAAEPEAWLPVTVVDREIAPGQSSRFPFVPDRSFEASYLNTQPRYIVREGDHCGTDP